MVVAKIFVALLLGILFAMIFAPIEWLDAISMALFDVHILTPNDAGILGFLALIALMCGTAVLLALVFIFTPNSKLRK